MFRNIFCMCQQTKKKTCLVYVLDNAQGVCFKVQVRADCRKEESKSAKLDQELGPIDRESHKLDFVEFLNLAQAHENI